MEEFYTCATRVQRDNKKSTTIRTLLVNDPTYGAREEASMHSQQQHDREAIKQLHCSAMLTTTVADTLTTLNNVSDKFVH